MRRCEDALKLLPLLLARYPERLRLRRSNSSVSVIADPHRGQCNVMFHVGRRSRVAHANAAAPIGLDDGKSLMFGSLRPHSGQTARRIELAGPSKPPPPYAGRNWALSGFDVSPDGHSVAFGVTSPSNATPSAAIYLEPIDGSAAAKVIRVISGPRPYVWLERFSPDGRWLIGAHVITDASLVCSNPQDVDSSFRFGVSARSPGCSGQVSDLGWWRSAAGPQKSQTMHLALPEGVRQVAW
jgi:hypothetical protein